MDAARSGAVQQTGKSSEATVIGLAEDESDHETLLTVHPRSNGMNGTHDLDALDGSEGEYDAYDSDGWDNESLMQDTIEEMGDENLFDGDEEACTLEEAHAFRSELRTVGPEEFCRKTVEAGTITAKKLLTAFGIRPPPFLEGSPDEDYYGLLSLGISRELSKRIKLPQYNTIDDAVELIKKANNIIVLTGAGISTSLGIPDFRSKDIGLYAQLADLGLSDPQDVFSLKLFEEDPSIFFSVAKNILPDIDRFTPTHKFIYLLQNKGKLLTNYSQNIDNIESVAGILPEKLIQCHGSFATATCRKCQYQVPGDKIFPEMKADVIPRCDRCIVQLRNLKAPGAMKRKRSKNGQEKKRPRYNGGDSSDDDYDIPEAGIMKPDITFFGEQLPDKFSDRLTNHDKQVVDLVIVIGTSLKVAPVSEIIPYLPANIPQMYISREAVSHVNFDIDMLGDCDIVVAELCRRLNWDLDHEMAPKDQQIDVRLHEGFQSRHVITLKKDTAKTENGKLENGHLGNGKTENRQAENVKAENVTIENGHAKAENGETVGAEKVFTLR